MSRKNKTEVLRVKVPGGQMHGCAFQPGIALPVMVPEGQMRK